MLGHQNFKTKRIGRLYALLNRCEIVDRETYSLELFRQEVERGGSEQFLKILGSSSIEAMDISDYQGASVIHDLNTPLPDHLRNSYDTVIDGGTIEHVFNVPEALRSVMRLVRPGGRFIALTMANNYCNHGLYQFSFELFYRVFSPENGFEVKLANIYSGGKMAPAPDPGLTKKNGQLPASPDTTMLLIAAVKKAEIEPFQACWPAQGQYAPQWQRSNSASD